MKERRVTASKAQPATMNRHPERHATGTDLLQGVALRGRDVELGMLDKRLYGLLRGRGGLVLVRGEAGMGKTSLLESAYSIATGRGAVVFRGETSSPERSVVLTPILPSASQLDRRAVLPESLRQRIESQTSLLVHELESVLEDAAMSAPVVVGVDDYQWADTATAHALGSLLQRLASYPILWLVAGRTGYLSASAQQTLGRLRAVECDVLALGRLDDHAVEQVVADVLRGMPDAALLEVVRECGGHPFLIVELLRGLLDEGLVEVTDGSARLMREELPDRLRVSVGEQVRRLTPATRELLELGSVLGRTFSVSEVAALNERPVAELLNAVREAIEAGLVDEQDDRLAFRHDLVREAIDATIPASVRTALRRRALEVMLNDGAPAADVASLVMQVAGPEDTAATKLLERAAIETGKHSPALAAPMITRALELTAVGDPGYGERFVSSVRLLVGAGQASQVYELLQHASLHQTVGATALAEAQLLAVPLVVQYSGDAAVALCRAVGEADGVAVEMRVRGLALLVGCLDILGSTDALPTVAHDAVTAAAASARDSAVTVSAALPRALAACRAGDWLTGLQAIEDVADLLAVGREPPFLLLDAWRSLILVRLDRLTEVRPLVADGIERSVAGGRLADMRIWSMVHALELWLGGALTDARAEADAVLEQSDEMAANCAVGYVNDVAHYVRAVVALHTGNASDLTVARRWAAQTTEAQESNASVRLAAWVQAQLSSLAGEASGSLDSELLDPLSDGPFRVSDVRRYSDIPQLIKMLIVRSQHDDAVAVTERLAAAADGAIPLPHLQATNLHAQGVLHGRVDLLRDATELYGDHSQPLVRAAVLEDTGSLMPDDKTQDAISHLDAALDLYVRAGADRDAFRVRGLLRQRGVRRPASPAPRSARWPELSASEEAVVLLVASGATNREAAQELFLSRHTINAHLRNVFPKLGVKSRVELAKLVAERETLAARWEDRIPA